MTRRFSKEVDVELMISGGGAIRLKAMIDFVVESQMGEIEVVNVVALRPVGGAASLEVPRWLNDFVCENVDHDELRDVVFFSGDTDGYFREAA